MSVVNNPLLYQEGWGVGRMKHSLTYSGGHSRSYTRTYAPLRRFGFEGFSPFTRPSVIEAAEDIPFAALTEGRPSQALRPEGRDRFARRRGPDGAAHAGLSEAPLPAGSPPGRRALPALPFPRGGLQDALSVALLVISSYPALPADRDRWILERRGPRNTLDPRRPYAEISEIEPDDSGEPVTVSTIFLTNRECPWRCLMCDLWRNTLTQPLAPGAIPEQIRSALSRLPPARWVKLYNAGSFFDPKAIPPADYTPVAGLLSGFERIIVESHPALVGESCLELRDAVAGELEVAMGLETVHPEVLPRLNKRMTLEEFRRASAFLRESGISLRVFVLVGLPFLSERESLDWACRSVEFAFDCGASRRLAHPDARGQRRARRARGARRVSSGESLRARKRASPSAWRCAEDESWRTCGTSSACAGARGVLVRARSGCGG